MTGASSPTGLGRKRAAAAPLEATRGRPPSPPPVRPHWLITHPHLEFPARVGSISVARIYRHLASLESREFAVISSIDVTLEEAQFLLGRIAEQMGQSPLLCRGYGIASPRPARSFPSMVRWILRHHP